MSHNSPQRGGTMVLIVIEKKSVYLALGGSNLWQYSHKWPNQMQETNCIDQWSKRRVNGKTLQGLSPTPFHYWCIETKNEIVKIWIPRQIFPLLKIIQGAPWSAVYSKDVSVCKQLTSSHWRICRGEGGKETKVMKLTSDEKKARLSREKSVGQSQVDTPSESRDRRPESCDIRGIHSLQLFMIPFCMTISSHCDKNQSKQSIHSFLFTQHVCHICAKEARRGEYVKLCQICSCAIYWNPALCLILTIFLFAQWMTGKQCHCWQV